MRTNINISSNRYTGFIQNTWDFLGKNRRFSVTAGIRGNYWDFNKQFLVSPRATVSYKPNWKKDIVLRFSAGYYYQPPFYRELRDFAGNINYNIKATLYMGDKDISEKIFDNDKDLIVHINVTAIQIKHNLL